MKKTPYLLFKCRLFSIMAFIILLMVVPLYTKAQEASFKKTSIRSGLGLGVHEGNQELGTGLVQMIGWHHHLGPKNKIRINPNFLFGGFFPFGITDTPRQFYKFSSLELNVHYDLLRYKQVSLTTSGGGFFSFTRGLMGTGGRPDDYSPKEGYFFNAYGGGNLSLAIRIDNPNHRFAYEFRPLNLQFGNNYYLLGYLLIGVDIKLYE